MTKIVVSLRSVFSMNNRCMALKYPEFKYSHSYTNSGMQAKTASSNPTGFNPFKMTERSDTTNPQSAFCNPQSDSTLLTPETQSAYLHAFGLWTSA